MTDRTSDRTRPDSDRTTIAEAAERLGISTDAVRKRLHRGQLPGEKVGGSWVVFLPRVANSTKSSTVDAQIDRDDVENSTPDRTESSLGPDQDRTESRSDRTGPDSRDRLIAALEADVTFLREQLDHSRRELAAERERSDVIQQLALQRIPPLGSGLSNDWKDEPRTDPLVTHSEAQGEAEPAKEGTDTLEESRSWWRRLLGMT